jgi:hypothetical protein
MRLLRNILVLAPCGKPQATDIAHVTALLQWLPKRANFTNLDHQAAGRRVPMSAGLHDPCPLCAWPVAAQTTRGPYHGVVKTTKRTPRCGLPTPVAPEHQRALPAVPPGPATAPIPAIWWSWGGCRCSTGSVQGLPQQYLAPAAG